MLAAATLLSIVHALEDLQTLCNGFIPVLLRPVADQQVRIGTSQPIQPASPPDAPTEPDQRGPAITETCRRLPTVPGDTDETSPCHFRAG